MQGKRWKDFMNTSLSPEGLRKMGDSSIFKRKATVAFFFLMWAIFKVFIEFVAVLLLFYVLIYLAIWHLGSYIPNQGSKP